MWVYYDNTGRIFQKIEHGTPARVGSVGVFSIFAYFNNIDIELYNVASLTLRRPDGTQVAASISGIKRNKKYSRLPSETLNGSFRDGQYYRGFVFPFDTNDLLDMAGTWQATITLTSSTPNHNVTGLLTFDVQPSAIEYEDVVLSYDQWQDLLALISSKMDLNTQLVVKTVSLNEIEDAGEGFPEEEFNLGDIIFNKDDYCFYKITNIELAICEKIIGFADISDTNASIWEE